LKKNFFPYNLAEPDPLPATWREGKGLEHCHTFHQKLVDEIAVKW